MTDETTALAALLDSLAGDSMWSGQTTDWNEVAARLIAAGVRVAPSPTDPLSAEGVIGRGIDYRGVAPSPDAPGRGWREASRDLIAAGDDEDEPSDGTVDRYRLIQEVRKAARGIDHSLADEPDFERFDAAIVALEHAAAARALEVVRLARPKCDLVCGHTGDHWIAEENDDA